METFSLKELFTWEFLCYFFAFLSAFKSDLWKENRRSHVKIYFLHLIMMMVKKLYKQKNLFTKKIN